MFFLPSPSRAKAESASKPEISASERHLINKKKEIKLINNLYLSSENIINYYQSHVQFFLKL